LHANAKPNGYVERITAKTTLHGGPGDLGPTRIGTRPSRLEVVAGVEAALQNSDVWLAIRIADYLLGQLPPLAGRPGDELTQTRLRIWRIVENRGERWVLRIQGSDELVVRAGGVDGGTQVGVCRRDPGPSGERQRQTTNCNTKSGQRQFGHV
jgi:hypothetical protein